VVSPVHVIDNIVQPVVGLTSLDEWLFVARCDQSDIEVCETATFAHRGHEFVSGLGSRITGLTSCAANWCIYIADSDTKTIHRRDYEFYELEELILIGSAKWRVDGSPQEMAVNSLTDYVIVACQEGKLLEYATAGILLRVIILRSDLTHPCHAIDLHCDGDQFVVSHGWYADGPQRTRVCVVNSVGAL
jgi:hypothetical protein